MIWFIKWAKKVRVSIRCRINGGAYKIRLRVVNFVKSLLISEFESDFFIFSRRVWLSWYSDAFFGGHEMVIWRCEINLAHPLILMISLPPDSHLPKRLRKRLKKDFRRPVPRKSIRVRYDFKWFWKLYNLSCPDSRFIRCVSKSSKFQNSTLLCQNRFNVFVTVK